MTTCPLVSSKACWHLNMIMGLGSVRGSIHFDGNWKILIFALLQSAFNYSGFHIKYLLSFLQFSFDVVIRMGKLGNLGIFCTLYWITDLYHLFVATDELHCIPKLHWDIGKWLLYILIIEHHYSVVRKVVSKVACKIHKISHGRSYRSVIFSNWYS